LTSETTYNCINQITAYDTNPGSPGKMAVKTECVMHCLILSTTATAAAAATTKQQINKTSEIRNVYFTR